MPTYVSCNLCGSDQSVIIGRKARFGLPLTNVVCKHCGLVYVNPRMDDEELQRFYRDRYREEFFGAGTPNSHVARKKLRKADNWYRFISPYVRAEHKVLDIGCETGSLLYLLKRRIGCEVVGIEPTTTYAEYGGKERGLNVLNGMFPEVELPHSTYDVVVLCHVLEHMADPMARLRDVHELLAPDGKLFVSVPSILHVRGRLGQFLQHSHLFNFTSSTLSQMLCRAGFSVEAKRINKYGIDIRAHKVNEASQDSRELPCQDWSEIVRYCRRYRMRYAAYGWAADVPKAVRWVIKRRLRARGPAHGGIRLGR